tara:strand:+ start:2669 stop:3517 length:849 start_codon:yes stop_codon:yes gene_type:complete
MIFWIASYPKSGNTWLRTLISSYYYSSDGIYNKDLINYIGQFPQKRHFESFSYDAKSPIGTSDLWIKAQEKINKDKKIRFFKTHNVFGKINNNPFTNKQNSLGCIYVVRDPRNVITSLCNHYELSYEEAFKWMINHKKYIYDDIGSEDYGSFQFISSWSNNYKSWKIQKDIPIKIVRYEDLLEKTYIITKEIIEFINKTTKKDEKINKVKLKNCVKSTLFDNLKNKEKEEGFSEAIFSKKKNKLIPFFNLGPKNDWTKILDKDLQLKIYKIFKSELMELKYK